MPCDSGAVLSSTRSLTTALAAARNSAAQAPWLRPITDHVLTGRALRRARIVSAVTMVAGAPVLRRAITSPSGGRQFQRWTLVLAATWTGGALSASRLHAGYSRMPQGRVTRPVLWPLLIGVGATGVFAAGAVLTSQIRPLRERVESVVDHARDGSLPVVVGLALVTGVTEELFFRGALYAALDLPVLHPVVSTTAVYTVVTCATGNPMLVFAAGLLGVVTGLDRHVTGGVQGPVIIHLTWSAGMLLVLPPLVHHFDQPRRSLVE
ncbi:hypothetical protein BKA23_2571 [Rudaeicoccus suwonensis]|uniref:CAAX prenyl protease 2/Lysostaphin resistance protein A-like domain-containing protein n=1 Tax=Rudaeicoccus suwonensis TaxID=657409 RepID=A0A561E3M9_9MICO|nr:hypothetical protein BKA23_2571 [Rudaeicoccus suwonensis]